MGVLVKVLILTFSVSLCTGILFNNAKSKSRNPGRPLGGWGVFRIMSKMTMPELQDEAYMTGPELIKRAGYPLEIHQVETKDGYILELHRIPGGYQEKSGNVKKTPVLLQSSLVTAGTTSLVLFERNQSLAYLLADAGFDVWIGNYRGTEFSWHKELTRKDYDYWKFSMDEIGLHDVASSIDYIIEKTGFKKIFSISQKFAGMSNLILYSKKPEYNDKVITNIMISPLWQVSDVRLSHVIHGGVQTVYELLRPIIDSFRGDMFASDEFIRWFGRALCYNLPNCFTIMNTILSGGGTEDKGTFNETRGPALMANVLAAYSARPIHHVVMTIYDKEVREYDWSPEENKYRFGREKTQAYDLKNVSVETLLIYGKNDLLAGKEEMEIIAKSIKHPILYEAKDPNFSMIMAYAGTRNKAAAYDKIIEHMQKRSKNIVA